MDRDIMKKFIGKVIKINRGGPESKIGMLMDTGDDHITILTEVDGIVYYKTNHIKSFTDNIKESMSFDIDLPENLTFIKGANLQELLGSMKYKWIKINRGGPETIEGVLANADNDSIFLINGQELVRLSMNHIKSISYGLKIQKTNSENTYTQQSQQREGKSSNSSQNKKNNSQKNKNKNKNKKNRNKRSSQKTTDNDAETNIANPLSITGISFETDMEEAEMNQSLPKFTTETSQGTPVGEDDGSLSIPLATIETSKVMPIVEDESNLAIPLSALEASQVIPVFEDESDLSIPLSTWETSQETPVGEDESDLETPLYTMETTKVTTGEDMLIDLAVLITLMKKFIRKYSNNTQN
ncbi:hypothetical protein M3610_14420 [Neobacillus sp. MER 74]|uniref:hypothetical protein n=1 Tax=Neobacillus sp. MER 74 TaxID=2939566 RepID=UPI00203C5B25|nr:hypothetical protein [Neobacillus sp. MER 74]MCM3116494.1 hypothetical protein [Neobacillus sp. MER 74]